MMGTLAGFLARKGVETPEDRYWADVEGDIEDVGGVLKITRIRVNYRIRVPRGKSGQVRESLAAYLKFCPAAQSVIGCIQIQDEANIEELGG